MILAPLQRGERITVRLGAAWWECRQALQCFVPPLVELLTIAAALGRAIHRL